MQTEQGTQPPGYGNLKLFLTPAEVAADLRISTSTVLRLIHAGKLPAIAVSERIYRIPAATLERFKAGTLNDYPRVQLRRTRTDLPPIGADEILPKPRASAV